MAVPVPKRKPGELDVNTMTRGLCTYTLRITANPKTFPEDQKSFTEQLRKTALAIHTKCGIPRENVDMAYAAWRNHASKGNSFHLLQRMDNYYHALWKGDLPDESQQNHHAPC